MILRGATASRKRVDTLRGEAGFSQCMYTPLEYPDGHA